MHISWVLTSAWTSVNTWQAISLSRASKINFVRLQKPEMKRTNELTNEHTLLMFPLQIYDAEKLS